MSDQYDDLEKMYAAAVDVIRSEGRVGVQLLQRRLRIGFNRACNLIERMEEDGFVSSANNLGVREVVPQKPFHSLSRNEDTSAVRPETKDE